MPRVRPMPPTFDDSRQRQEIHLLGCNCTGCLPPSPFDRGYQVRAAIETLRYMVVGGVSIWIVDRMVDGPGLQILFGY